MQPRVQLWHSCLTDILWAYVMRNLHLLLLHLLLLHLELLVLELLLLLVRERLHLEMLILLLLGLLPLHLGIIVIETRLCGHWLAGCPTMMSWDRSMSRFRSGVRLKPEALIPSRAGCRRKTMQEVRAGTVGVLEVLRRHVLIPSRVTRKRLRRKLLSLDCRIEQAIVLTGDVLARCLDKVSKLRRLRFKFLRAIPSLLLVACILVVIILLKGHVLALTLRVAELRQNVVSSSLPIHSLLVACILVVMIWLRGDVRALGRDLAESLRRDVLSPSSRIN